MKIIRKLGKNIQVGDILHHWTGNHRIEKLEEGYSYCLNEKIKIATSSSSKLGLIIEFNEYLEVCVF